MQYGGRAELLYTDTDSLVLEVQTEDVYADMACNAYQYDTSNYPRDHPLNSTANKKVLGKMKNECTGTPIAEFVGDRVKDVLNLDSRWCGDVQNKGRQEVCREKAHPPLPVQGCILPSEAIRPWYGHAAQSVASHLWLCVCLAEPAGHEKVDCI